MRTLTVLLLALLMITPAAALAPAASSAGAVPTGAAALDGALADAAQYEALIATYPPGASLAAQLETATGSGAASVPTLGFEDAMALLYVEAGVALPSDYERPAPELQAALAPVVSALTVSAQLTNGAFAALTDEERAFLFEHLALLVAPTSEASEEAQRVADLSLRVDMPLVESAAATLARGLDGFSASSLAATWISPGGLIEVGSTGDDAYCAERMLVIDLGGNDLYDCHPASYAPGSNIPLPVSAILDLGGNDLYTTTNLHVSSLTSTWGQAVGIGGVGLIVDRWGDDVYHAQLVDAVTVCSEDFWEGSPQLLYAQAVGALGVGAILDASGNDVYQAVNVNDLTVNCHFGWAYTFAQGVGLARGVGLLVDDTGDESYFAFSKSLGKFDNIAATYAQASAAGGVAVLADKEGHDSYVAQSDGRITFGLTKGAFAYVFAQASVAATRKQPSSSVAFADLGQAVGVPNTTCPSARGGSGTDTGSAACDGAGAALLLDVLGNDVFFARTFADDQNAGCWNGLWSVVSAQGSAAWSGLAALVNADIEGKDQFILLPYARGNLCGQPATRAHAYGQGYGGPILWNFWDEPQPRNADQLGVGILASVGIPEETCPGNIEIDRVQLPANGILGIETPIAKLPTTAPCKADLPRLAASPDSYTAYAQAENPGFVADARTLVQGASNRVYTIPGWSFSTYPVLGVGIHLDIGGADTFDAVAEARGAIPDGLVIAQGATEASIASLTNVGGADTYHADVLLNGASSPWLTLVQGFANGGGGIVVPGTCVIVTNPPINFCIAPIAIAAAGGIATFVEIFGYDSYSEAPERFGCMTNGDLLGGWPLGVPLGTVWWGHVLGSPCPAPTPDVGTGTVIGLDWWSDAF